MRYNNLDKYYSFPNLSEEEKNRRRNELLSLLQLKSDITENERFDDFAGIVATKLNLIYEKYTISNYPSYLLTFSPKKEQKYKGLILSTKYNFLFSLVENVVTSYVIKEIFESYKYKKNNSKIENYIRFGEVYLSSPLQELEFEYYLIIEEIQKKIENYSYKRIEEFSDPVDYEIPFFHASSDLRLFNLLYGGYPMKGKKLDFQW